MVTIATDLGLVATRLGIVRTRNRAFTCALALSLLIACSSTPTQTTTPTITTTTAATLRSVDWRNHTYIIEDWRVTVRDGVYQAPPEPDGITFTVAIEEQVAYGDLTGDGVDEAVIMMRRRQTVGPAEEIMTGESVHTSTMVLIYTQAAFGERPRLIGIVDGSDAAFRVERTSITGGVLTVMGQRDAQPSEERHRWDGTEFVPVE